MKRYLFGGLLIVVIVLLTQAPVSLLKPFLPPAGQAVELQQLRGTLWRAAATVHHQGRTLGDLSWQFQPARLLSGQLAFAWQMAGRDVSGTGTAGRSLSAWHLTGDGVAASRLFAPLLAEYELVVPGQVTLAELVAASDGQRVTGLAGNLLWPGGSVTFPQGNRLATIAMPPLNAELKLDAEQQPLAEVFQADGQGQRAPGADYPLLTLTALASGFAKVAVTRRLTRLAGVPWPGSEPDHAVVLEVEQQVF
jgi:hypothetical protein